MARIRVEMINGTRRVTVSGPLRAADLGRFERACGPALEQRQVALEIRVRAPSGIDGPARLFLDGLVKRGAIVR